ncbi:hypothetical protein MHIB_02580 [Mycolicibacter hiberniae]|uniref:Uncharacterized protein n=1 Tax=Mycolicibacter hiberniae TaxID=29314 RepID=A0A7I7WXH9_9MYCO|nr:hypothetical protein MHIB_02580 [Mycolicibacter hiberniae]
MVVMLPSRGVSTEIRSGNSMVIRSVRGHHAPSIPPPSSRATVTRTGRAWRVLPTGAIIAAAPTGADGIR